MKIRVIMALLAVIASQACFAQLTFKDIKFDTGITGFKFAVDFQGTMVYTPNGKPDLERPNPTAFSYSLANDYTYIEGVAQIEGMMEFSHLNGYEQNDVVRKETVINGYKAYYVSYTETQPGTNYKNFAFHGVLVKGTAVVVFVSGDLDGGKYIEGIKKTFFETKL